MSEFARLRWLCRRGMKELDLVMSRYLELHYLTASSENQGYFKDLLDMQDPELYDLLLGRNQVSDPGLRRLLQFLRAMSGDNQQG